jgi:DNA-binding transcriptional LysR family regulator
VHPNLIDHLTTFVTVVDTGSLSAAARALRRPVSSISYSLTQLESHCGFSLMERARRPVVLTDRGRALFAEANSIVERARRFTSRASSLEKGEETRLRVAVDVLFPLTPLYQALAQFSARYPHAVVQFFNSSLATLWEDLRAGRYDFALSLVATIPSDMVARSFYNETLGPVCAIDHSLAARPQPLPARAFDQERQIYYLASPEIDMERVGRLFSTNVWTVSEAAQIRAMVLAGLGWCFGSASTFAGEFAAGKLYRLRCAEAQFHPIRTVAVGGLIEAMAGVLTMSDAPGAN